LHHYEELGLLSSDRGEGGHRLYGEAAVERLYRIRVLLDLGLGLAEIGKVIGDGASLASVMDQHLARVEQEVEALTRLRDRLRQIRGTAEAEELLQTIDAMSRLERHVAARPMTGGEGWKALGAELRGLMEAGVEPASRQVRPLARRARTMIQAFAGGDEAVIAALAHMRAAAPVDLPGWDAALMTYLDQALKAEDPNAG
jgi:DNA-binding transcriptional MerR regulator